MLGKAGGRGRSPVVVCCHFSCLRSPSWGSSVVSNADRGLPEPGVLARLGPELSELAEGMSSQHLLNLSCKTPALLWL